MDNTKAYVADVGDIYIEAERAYHMLDIITDDLFWSENPDEEVEKFKLHYARYRALAEVARNGAFRICELAEEIEAQPPKEVMPCADS